MSLVSQRAYPIEYGHNSDSFQTSGRRQSFLP